MMELDTAQFTKDSSQPISDAKEIAEIVQKILQTEEEHARTKEHLYGIGLNTALRIDYIELISIGSVDYKLAKPKDILRLGIIRNCSYIIIAHNHSSGVLKPSKQDRELTLRLGIAAEMQGITLLDHIIFHKGKFLSLEENNVILDFKKMVDQLNSMQANLDDITFTEGSIS